MAAPSRSISFPPRSKPDSLEIEESLNKLRSFEVLSSSSSSSSENIRLGLIKLAKLYGYLQGLILSPTTQHGLSRNTKLAEESLDGSVRLIDTCSSARNMVLRFKDQMRELQSALRRKGCTSHIENEVRAYMGFRKLLAKDVMRCIKTLRQDEGKYNKLKANYFERQKYHHDDPYLVIMARVLREVFQVTIFVFNNLYLFLLAKPTRRTPSIGWSLIARFIKSSSSSSRDREEVANEVAKVDLAILELDFAKIDVGVVRGKLEMLDSNIRVLEEELEGVFKCLVENRVSMLNILTH